MTSAGTRGTATRQTGAAALFFLAITLAATWPQILRMGDGLTDPWDAKLIAWVLKWDYAQTFRAPLELFHAPFFHPARYVLAFSENVYGASLFAFPFYAAGASPVLGYNVVLLSGMFLSALGAWALARYVTGDPLASVVAGVIYAFVPWRIAQLPHLQHQWGAFLALLLLFVLRYLDLGKRRDAVLFGVCFAWNALANLHYAVFSGFLVALVLLFQAVEGGADRGRRIRGALLAAAIAALLCVPFAIPYARAASIYDMRRGAGEMVSFSARPTDFLSAGPRNRLYGSWTKRWDAPEGNFFPGIAALGLAAVALARLRGPREPHEGLSEPSRARRRLARALDLVAIVTAGVLLASLLHPHLRIGPLRAGDPGRVFVVLTVVLLGRLAVAFPKRSRRKDLADYLRSRRLPTRAMLLLSIGALGVLFALGGHTPFYRFLFQSFPPLQAIRGPARWIVLFHLTLAVLAAWGLSALMRGAGRRARLAGTAAALVLVGLEYRAAPLQIEPHEAAPAPVYRWIRGLSMPGAVVEWPVGPLEAEYVLRQADHGKPLVNGYSGFFPRPYLELQRVLKERPIPDSAWDRLAALDASLLVFHAHDQDPAQRLRGARALHRGVASGRLQPIGALPHGEHRDYLFRLTSAPSFEAALPATAGALTPEEVALALSASDAVLAPPFGVVDRPAEGEEVEGGAWGFGWALDDSGIAEIRVGTELGEASLARLGGDRPEMPKVFPDYADAARAGFGFPVPRVAPGRHTLVVTLIAKDGGNTVLRRSIVVR